MKAPKCWTCKGRHWSTQPCAINGSESAINTHPAINEERLTDAINTGTPASLGEQRALRTDAPHPNPSDKPDPPTRLATIDVSAKTPNRRTREDYNAYMKEYMKRRRHG